MHELGLTWDYVMDMTWKEYCLRKDGFYRSHKEDWYKFRFVGYQIYCSIPVRGKHVSIDKFLPLDDKVKPNFTDAMKEKIRQEHEKIKNKWQMS